MTLKTLRTEIDAINHDLITLFAKRIAVAKEIARIKYSDQLPVLDEDREKELLKEVGKLAKAKGLSAAVIEEIFILLLAYSRLEMQLEIRR